ncbi:cardiolipin synthase [Paenibacillus sp. FJAT-26967]|uniref:cardiolipin synthase n=1 Tax=Paenibacillus sp. FJAT-26967 TaxID=1729690 RepID=UPI0020A3B936|nr:cardiolipin synthase [Paenibacillus sp. FJAT-26967]
MQHIYSLIPILNLLFAAAVVFLERKNPGVTWAWVMVLVFLPGFGFFLYLVFGQNLSRRKIYKLKEFNQKDIEAIIEGQRQGFRESEIQYKDPLMADYQDLIYMNLSSSAAVYTQDNEVVTYTDGDRKFNALLDAIRKATNHIHLMYYIVKDDRLGQRILEALTAKAREGVKVRFLYDDIGSVWLPKSFFRPLVEAGGEVAVFFPSKIPYLNFRFNYRNHRKLAIIDGAVGFIGGFNIGDEYLGLLQRFGYWRDTHLKIEGSAVLQMQAQFFMDWNLASTNSVKPEARYYPRIPFNGHVGVQIVSSGPDSELEQIRNGYLKMIYAAKESIYIQTPYFIPDESLMTAVKMAALAGVDIRIMIPSVPDHKMVYWATTSYLGELLNLGVKGFLYEKGFLHAKTIVIDGKVASIGTANVDIRSFKLNFEVNAFIYDTETAARQKKIFEKDMLDCSEFTPAMFRNRSLPARFKESLARLISPIL